MDNTPAAISITPFAATEAHDKYYQDFFKWLGEMSFDPVAWDLYLPNCSRDEVQHRFVRMRMERNCTGEPCLTHDIRFYNMVCKSMANIIERRYREKGFGIFLDCDEEMSDEECPPPSPVNPLPEGPYMTINEVDELHVTCDQLCNDDDCTIVKEIEVIKLD
jgi:hypothetical protein